MVRIKVCGISTERSIAAVSNGVDYVGFNFWPKSRRYLTLERACLLQKQLPDDVQTVALFVDPAREAVEQVLERFRPRLLQFHGEETPAFCRSFGVPYMKAVRLRDEASIETLGAYLESPDGFILIDAYTPLGVGGTGHPVDLGLAKRARERYPRASLFLAGGLDAASVGRAIAEVEPYAVDVASGVERAAGDKCGQRVAAFVAAVRGGHAKK